MNENPGPGAYEYIKPKVKVLSVYKENSSLNGSILPNTSSTVNRIPFKNMPGPQCYNLNNTFMSSQSTFVDTRKRTMSGNRFGNSSRRPIFDTSKEYTPGPGTYKASSAFGHYMSRLSTSVSQQHGYKYEKNGLHILKLNLPSSFRINA